MVTVVFMAKWRSDGTWTDEIGLRTRMVFMGGVSAAAQCLGLGRRLVIVYLAVAAGLIGGGIILGIARASRK